MNVQPFLRENSVEAEMEGMIGVDVQPFLREKIWGIVMQMVQERRGEERRAGGLTQHSRTSCVL